MFGEKDKRLEDRERRVKNKEFELRSTTFVSWKRREKGLRKGRSSSPLWESESPKNGQKENPGNIKKRSIYMQRVIW